MLNGVNIQLLSILFASIGLAAILITYNLWTGYRGSDIVVIFLVHCTVFYLSGISNDLESLLLKGFLKLFESVLVFGVAFTLSLSFIAFISDGSFVISREEFIYLSLLNILSTYLGICVFKIYCKKLSNVYFDRKKTIVVTTGKRLSSLWKNSQTQALSTGQIVGIVVLDATEKSFDFPYPFVSEEEAVQYANRNVVDCVFIDIPDDMNRLQYWVSEFETMGIDVHVNLNLFDFETIGSKRVQLFAGQTVLTFATKFYKRSHVIAKRILDIFGSIIGLMICAVVMIVLAPFILRDGGSLFFKQKRVGKNGRYFILYKFRSMSVDAEKQKEELLQFNQMQGGMFKMEDDPRITPIGRFIRKTSLDELPQFYNVLIGDMSLVGTRPPTVDEFKVYSPYQKRRLSIKPGITGLWQVSGRSNITDFDEVVRLDLTYIDNWTIWSDIKILLKTVKVVLLREGSK
ncbi:TPA: sugar transferase [Streptococcus suis]|nr:sugar transferase [Streptococcus suis]